MKVRSNSYELRRVNENYDKIAEALRDEAILHSVVGNREQFQMPGGKVTLQLRKIDDTTYLDVIRTSLFEPKYVRGILEQLDGVWAGGSSGRVCPDKMVELFVGKK